ncbi:MAG: transporter, family, methylenomycin resistance protein [Verrucomicrobiota bacterium]|jgi:MFS transporter, DHA2 family, methylenomycin A resistance protein|nr:transporter, family, methylenomycin resistance protein [Verrucomicrobiota bacterium]
MSDRLENVVEVPRLEGNRPYFTAFITCLGCVVVLLDISIVNVALQRISDGLGGNVSDLQWIVDAYTLAFASFLLTAGTAGDRYGNKAVFAAGFILFTLASVFCGTAGSLAALIAARVLQGLGAALIIPCSLTLLNHAFDDPAQRAKAFGWWAGSGGVSVAAGPLIGGFLVHIFGWRSIFFVNLPIGVAALLLTIFYIREEQPIRGRKIDLAGQIVSLLALAALITVLIEGAKWGWLSPGIVGLAAAFCLLSFFFFFIETRQSDPMLPLSLFHSVPFSVAALLGLLLSFSFYGLIFTLSLYFQQVRHYSPLKTGLAFLPVTGLLTIMNVYAGRLAAKRGMRFPIVVGFVVGAIGFFWLGSATNETAGYANILLPLVGIGAGVPLILPPVTSVLLASVDRSQVGLASATLNASRQIGAAAGVAVLGSLLTAYHTFVVGFRVAMIVSGGICLIGTWLAVRFIPPQTDKGSVNILP